MFPRPRSERSLHSPPGILQLILPNGVDCNRHNKSIILSSNETWNESKSYTIQHFRESLLSDIFAFLVTLFEGKPEPDKTRGRETGIGGEVEDATRSWREVVAVAGRLTRRID